MKNMIEFVDAFLSNKEAHERILEVQESRKYIILLQSGRPTIFFEVDIRRGIVFRAHLEYHCDGKAETYALSERETKTLCDIAGIDVDNNRRI